MADAGRTWIVVAVLSAGVASLSSHAHAARMVATYTGTVRAGVDTANVFDLGAGADLLGDTDPDTLSEVEFRAMAAAAEAIASVANDV